MTDPISTTATEDALWGQAADYRERTINPMANRSTDPGVAADAASTAKVRDGHKAIIVAGLLTLLGTSFGAPGLAAALTLAVYGLTRRPTIGWKAAAVWIAVSAGLSLAYTVWTLALRMS